MYLIGFPLSLFEASIKRLTIIFSGIFLAQPAYEVHYGSGPIYVDPIIVGVKVPADSLTLSVFGWSFFKNSGGNQ